VLLAVVLRGSDDAQPGIEDLEALLYGKAALAWRCLRRARRRISPR
jgi:hypothetical protein